MLVHFSQGKLFEQFCQSELLFSFAKVNCNAWQHFSCLFSFSHTIESLCYKRIKELVHDLAVHLSSYDALGKFGEHL